jgi:hypothetical protein
MAGAWPNAVSNWNVVTRAPFVAMREYPLSSIQVSRFPG